MCHGCFNKQWQSYSEPINYIDDKIYLGNRRASVSKSILEEHGIKAICVCGE